MSHDPLAGTAVKQLVNGLSTTLCPICGLFLQTIARRYLTATWLPLSRDPSSLTGHCERLGVGDGKLLHVAQSLFHDHVPAKKAGLRTVWINRRHDRPGWGATPAPPPDVTPDWEFPSMAAFAAAVTTGSPRQSDAADGAGNG